MTTPSGQALKMRLELKQLGQRHAIAQKSMVIPLTAPLDHPQILEGYAATIDLDADRQRFRRYAFGYPLQRNAKNVPLLWRHTSEVAGRIQDIDYDDYGNLIVCAEVHHPLARRAGAFSIGSTVNDYEMRDVDSENFHAVINSATITEISLTDRPANSAAKVMLRYRTSPAVEHLELMIARVGKLVQLATFIKENAYVHG